MDVQKIIVEVIGAGATRTEMRVSVIEGGDRTVHHVVLAQDDLRRLSLGSEAPPRVAERIFERLLDRQPKEAIPSRFAVGDLLDHDPALERGLRTDVAGRRGEPRGRTARVS